MEEGIKENMQEGGESKASQMAGVLGCHREGDDLGLGGGQLLQGLAEITIIASHPY